MYNIIESTRRRRLEPVSVSCIHRGRRRCAARLGQSAAAESDVETHAYYIAVSTMDPAKPAASVPASGRRSSVGGTPEHPRNTIRFRSRTHDNIYIYTDNA